uniref:Evasin n=1 Tax=Rhipicephalus appendiculatus TaxID=34631 RepID=A0A131Z754_RHIAP
MLVLVLIVFLSMNLQLCQGDVNSDQLMSTKAATDTGKCNQKCSKDVGCPEGCICGRLGDNVNGTCYDIGESAEYDYSSPNPDDIEKAKPIRKTE